MQTPIGDYIQWVVTRAALDLFEKQAHEACTNVRLGLITRSDAVEILQAKAAYDQIIQHFGPQRAEQIMAEHLNKEVPA
ncbi:MULTISPECIES: hypothetical protein [Bradyrhizobium]|jgi:hypothetical protein|uniref:Uncharacterized protein n=1 Tax=Bradyrhizobium denitrificans TaxID=2734912 RepID=A0ABS5GGG7_9BRAD|nr:MULTISPECIES: hypothetical protein [Bradyrhizobium]MBR1140428.1 hypothetical protein [Bradyrhizobium denitrificans]MDU0957773.1 hypothetical protein [Bradyrhizobium sp.]MDU1496677.1 hypothetical protein [Bradyrhizobium sp.]MDU1546871.1 hypothetical protein [Bradyrhizobium sp.]MDU1688666.1 hypothetical protein [Bradyrhizobium sp.]